MKYMGFFGKRKGMSKSADPSGKKKKHSVLAKIALVVLIIFILNIALSAFGGLAFFLSFGGALSSRFWNAKDDEIPQASDDCQCGCIWILDDKQQTETVTDVSQTVVDSNGNVDTSSLKLLGTGTISVYTKEDNDDGSGNFNTLATSSGADATPGITVAIASEATGRIPHPDLYENWGLQLGDWVYIEHVGIRQVQDLCGTSNRVDVFVEDDSDQSEPAVKYNIKPAKVWFISNGTAKQGSQDGVVPPTVTATSTTVPSYGYTTGSTTDTSIDVPTYTGNTKALVDALLPGAVVASQYYDIHIPFVFGKQPAETGWSMVTSSATASSNGYNLFNVGKTNDFTGEVVSGGRWCKYSSYEEAIIDYARVFHQNSGENNGPWKYIQNLKYSDVLAAYSKGFEAQADAVAYTGYCDHAESIKAEHKTVSEATVKQYAAQYAQNIKDIGGKAKELQDIDVAMAYLKANNLMDRYNEALEWMKKYEAKKKLAKDTPNGGDVSTESSEESEESGNGSGGHWECECKKPCPYCHCHDEETEEDGDKGSGAGMTFPEETPGEASGLWGTTAELTGYINALNDNNMPLNVTNLSVLKSNLSKLVSDMGKKPATQYTYKTDKFLGPDGWGFVVYDQASSSSNEPFLRKNYNDYVTKTFGSSGCGLYATANALSTLEKKWVSPAEVAIALQTYGVRNNTRISTTLMGNSSAAVISGLYLLVREAGYTDAMLDTVQPPDQKKVDECLSKGGLVIYVSTDSRVTRNAHYVVIREKAASGNYYLGDSVNHNDTEFTFSSIQTNCSDGDGTLYIYPKPGESIEERKANANKGKEDGNTSSNQISTSEPIGNTGIISYRLDGKMDPLTSPWFRNSPGSYPYNAFHGAADYGAIYQDLVSIFDDGTVTRVDYNDGGYGKYVVIYYSNGLYVLYAHMSEILVSVGQKLTKGEHIGKSGETGAGTGPHLHLQVMVRGGYRAGNVGESFVIDAQALYAGYAIEQCKVRLYGYKTLGAVVRDGIEIGKPIQQAELFEAPYTGGETIDGQ